MKKRSIVILCVFFFGVLFLCLYADFNSYTDRTRTIPKDSTGLVFSITTYDGETEKEPFIPCFGHSWISVENQTGHSVSLIDYEIQDGELLTFSIWAITGHRGVYFNLEADFIRQFGRYDGRQSLSVCVDESRLAVIEDYIRKNDSWTFSMNCSRWAAELWNAVADEAFELKTQTLVYTPKRLLKSFGEFDCVESDMDFSDAKAVFFYQNGVRTELQLCS